MVGMKVILLGVWDYVICVNIWVEADTSRLGAPHVDILSQLGDEAINVGALAIK